MPPQELLTKLVSQNQLTGDVEETQVILTFDSGNGLSTVIVDVSPNIFRQLQQKKRIFHGWTSCPFEENLHLTFCTQCCSTTSQQDQIRASTSSCGETIRLGALGLESLRIPLVGKLVGNVKTQQWDRSPPASSAGCDGTGSDDHGAGFPRNSDRG
ncbi:hypothetical protein HPB47_014134 [Ixodes persulcatus]|uniref:Uncharacterized protein n=1 Tax=Ixodes persulcatus TaxID=34615 RepID=A0AC60QWY1_IXOPE|nr:hypothetical protein HPB47_014134 [Ixodes persulcatus]